MGEKPKPNGFHAASCWKRHDLHTRLNPSQHQWGNKQLILNVPNADNKAFMDACRQGSASTQPQS